MITPSSDSTRTLIDDYLAEQQRLQTPVRRFSDAHDQQTLALRSSQWRDLIPLSQPGAGEQYAFEVDVDRCTGCKACVAGCHSLNGLEEEETWRDIGLVLGGTRSQPFQQTITTACHHCADPACLNGCPVLAYEKDPVTGIVRHLDDQCIGCQYCVLKCPYDVPQYSERLGIVRKCDMCHHRLAAGEAPACAQACPTQAIRIVTVVTTGSDGELLERQGDFLTSAPDPAYTKPTTRYISRRALPENAAAADVNTLRPQPAHWPLVLMLTLMPMAVGCFAIEAFTPHAALELPLIGFFAALVGLIASVFHLGQPTRAWRVFLGLRRSWLSREAVVFAAWLGMALMFISERAGPQLPGLAWLRRDDWFLGETVVAVGLCGLSCSAMVYVDTRRPFWRASQTFPRFFGAAAVLGAAGAFALYPSWPYTIALVSALLVKLAVETSCFRVLDQEDETPSPERQTALVLSGPLRAWTAWRYLSAFAAMTLAIVAMTQAGPGALRWLVAALALVTEGLERLLFFRAVFAPKMPGMATP